MSLSSASTLADALAQYQDNLCWWESATKAQNLLEAINYLLACKPETIAAADETVSFASLEPLRTKLESKVLNASTRSAGFVRGRPLYH